MDIKIIGFPIGEYILDINHPDKKENYFYDNFESLKDI